MERWVEKPSDDSLMFLPVWIRLQNIPINYYTEDTIKEIACCVRKVITVELDLEKSQAQHYVRVQVLFDVRNPLRNSKEVLIPTDEMISVSFDYERIRTRCFLCQRLTHEKSVCPYTNSGNNKEAEEHHRNSNSEILVEKSCLLKPVEKIVSIEVPSISIHKSSKIILEVTRNPTQELCGPKRSLPLSVNLDYTMDTEFPRGFTEAGSSGLNIKQKNPRKRMAFMAHKKQDFQGGIKEKEVSLNIEFANAIKLKKDIEDSERSECVEKTDITVVPHEPPQYQ